MFVKWVTCSIDARRRRPFSSAQQQWAAISDQPGLIGQVGGWSRDGDEAHIFAGWTDAEAYASFMRTRHDAVVEGSAQASTYRTIATSAGEVVIVMPGAVSTVRAALAAGSVLRLADCLLRAGRDEHFLDAQRTTWTPAMSGAGMLGGVCARLDRGRYLVATWWPDAGAHDRYARDEVPRLRGQADVEADVHRLTGRVIALEPTWRVLGDHTDTSSTA